MGFVFVGPTLHKPVVHIQGSERPHAHQRLIMDMAAERRNGLSPLLIFAPQTKCIEQGHTSSQNPD